MPEDLRGRLTVIQSLAMFVDMFSSKSGRYPSPASDIVIDMRDLRQHARYNLNATGSITNNGDTLVLFGTSALNSLVSNHLAYRVIVFLVPGGTVQQLALEIVETRNVRPLPVVQSTGRLNQDITIVFIHSAAINIANLRTAKVRVIQVSFIGCTHLQPPFRVLLIPCCLGDLLLQPDILHASILVHDTLPVAVYLRSTRIKGGPFFIRLEGSLVSVRWDVFPWKMSQ